MLIVESGNLVEKITNKKENISLEDYLKTDKNDEIDLKENIHYINNENGYSII